MMKAQQIQKDVPYYFSQPQEDVFMPIMTLSISIFFVVVMVMLVIGRKVPTDK